MPCTFLTKKNVVCGKPAIYVIVPELVGSCGLHIALAYNQTKKTNHKKADMKLTEMADINRYKTEPDLSILKAKAEMASPSNEKDASQSDSKEETVEETIDDTAEMETDVQPDTSEQLSPVQLKDLTTKEVIKNLIAEYVKTAFKIDLEFGPSYKTSSASQTCIHLLRCKIDKKNDYVIKFAFDTEEAIDSIYWEFCMYRNFETQADLVELYTHNGRPMYYRQFRKYAFLVYKVHGSPISTSLSDERRLTSDMVRQMITILKNCHDSGVVCYGMGVSSWAINDSNRIKYYGLHTSMKWVDAYVEPIPQVEIENSRKVSARKTLYYSINATSKLTISRIDDIESLLYIVLDLMKVPLPWANTSVCTQIIVAKETFMHGQCSVPYVSEITKLIRDTGFESSPDYDTLTSLFVKMVDAN